MSKRFKTNKKITWIYSTPVLVLLLIIVGVSVQATIGMYSEQSETSINRAQAAAELGQLERQKTRLQARLDHLETQQGVEAEIREKFSVAKEDEGVVIIIDSKEAKKSSEKVKDESWWSWLTNAF